MSPLWGFGTKIQPSGLGDPTPTDFNSGPSIVGALVCLVDGFQAQRVRGGRVGGPNRYGFNLVSSPFPFSAVFLLRFTKITDKTNTPQYPKTAELRPKHLR